MTLQQITSYSYDMFILADSILIISLTLYLADDIEGKETRKREWIILFISVLLLVPAKSFALLPVCMVPFLICFEKWSRKERKIKKYFLLLGIAIVFIIMFVTFTSKSNSASSNYISWADEEGHTLAEFIHNPGALLMIIGNTIYHKIDFYFGTVFGNSLGWFEINMPMTVIIPFFVLFLLTGIKKINEPVYLKNTERIFIGILALAGIGFACAGMLLSWTPKSYDLIMGIQGRYLLPFLPMLLFAMGSKRIEMHQSVEKEIMMFDVIAHVFVFVCVFIRVV